MKVDGRTDSSLGDTSEGVNGHLLPHLGTEVDQEGGLDVAWAVLLCSAQETQLEVLSNEDRGGVGSRGNVPGTAKTKTSQGCGKVCLLPLGVIQRSAEDARDCLRGDVMHVISHTVIHSQCLFVRVYGSLISQSSFWGAYVYIRFVVSV